MDEFFQNLREIQKKERSLSGLSPVGDDFYQQISSYFNRLMKRIDNNPFSFESYLLRDAQRIVVEICERREHKITNSVVMNVQRSYKIFKGNPEDGRPNVPSNSTPEEERLYMELYRHLAKYREEMRSPLRSYSNNNRGKKSTSATSNFSSQIEDEIDALVETNPQVTNHDEDQIHQEISSNKVSRDNKHSNGTDSISRGMNNPPFIDEIPPDIQDEIYKEFGREPGRKDSQSTSKPSKETKNAEVEISKRSKSRGYNEIREEPSANVSSISKDSKVSENSSHTIKASTEVLMILDELPSIMGVDMEVYGPFYPGDIITMPEPNARILIKNHKGKSIQRYK